MTTPIEYKVIRSSRKTLGIEITRDAKVLVRAPAEATREDIEQALDQKRKWISLHVAQQQEKLRQRQGPAAPVRPKDDPSRAPRVPGADIGIPYRLIRTGRKTLYIEINDQGELLARAPLDMPEREIEAFLQEQRSWIERTRAAIKAELPRIPNPPSPDDSLEFQGIPYSLVRSNRKTLSVEVTLEAKVLVRAPRQTSMAEIERFLLSRKDWITRHLAQMEGRVEAHPEPDDARWEELTKAASDYIPGRVRDFADLMGVYPTGLRLTRAKTRFGSCSADNRIMISIRVMDYPLAAVDYVIVHELAHIIYKNHSSLFYDLVASVLPDYKAREKLLKK